MFVSNQENEEFQKISCKLMNSVKNAQNFREIILVRLKNGKESPKIICKNSDFEFKKTKKLMYQNIDNLNETTPNTKNITNLTENQLIKYKKFNITKKLANKTKKITNKTKKIANKTRKLANLTKESLISIKNAEDTETKSLLTKFKAQFIRELVQIKPSPINEIIDFTPKYGRVSGFFPLILKFINKIQRRH